MKVRVPTSTFIGIRSTVRMAWNVMGNYNLGREFRAMAKAMGISSVLPYDTIQRRIIGEKAMTEGDQGKTCFKGVIAIELLREFSGILEVREQLPKEEEALLALTGSIFFKALKWTPTWEIQQGIPDEDLQEIANLIIEATIEG